MTGAWRANPGVGSDAVYRAQPGGGRLTDDAPLPDRVDFDPDYAPSAPITCERCGGRMSYVGGCKILCGNCGYRRDCSDP